MNRLSLKNNQLKFKTSGKLPIILDESMECISFPSMHGSISMPKIRTSSSSNFSWFFGNLQKHDVSITSKWMATHYVQFSPFNRIETFVFFPLKSSGFPTSAYSRCIVYIVAELFVKSRHKNQWLAAVRFLHLVCENASNICISPVRTLANVIVVRMIGVVWRRCVAQPSIPQAT